VASRKRIKVRKRVDKRAVQASKRVLRAMGKRRKKEEFSALARAAFTPFDIWSCEIF